MKLKKIASLALAGIMAVSMLAGCSTTGSDEEQNPTTPATSGIVAVANDALSGSQKAVLTFSNSATLDTILNDVATDASNLPSNSIHNIYTTIAMRSDNTLKGKVDNKLGGLIATNWSVLPADKVAQKGSAVYTVSGDVEEDAAVRRAVDMWDPAIANLPAAIVSNNTSYACTYSAEISAVKVANPEHTNETAWVVAIVLTQNVSEKANANA